jgi:hypothetical protein
MYNKYFTMKRSELKEAIKAEIKSVLSEEITEAKFVKFKGDSDNMKMKVEAEREMNTPDGELKVYTVKTDDGVQSYTADQVELVEVYQTRSKMEQIVSLFQNMMDDEYDGQDYRKVLNMVLKAIDDDYKAAEREGEKFSRIREDEEAIDEAKLADQELDFEKEPTKTQLKRGSGSITRVGYKLADLTKRMRDKAKEYKAAEGEAKEKIKDELKTMTAEKKKLEKSL